MSRSTGDTLKIPDPPPDLTLDTIDTLAPVLEQVWKYRCQISGCLNGAKDYVEFLERYINKIEKRSSPVPSKDAPVDHLDSAFELTIDDSAPTGEIEMYMDVKTLQKIWEHRQRFLVCLQLHRSTYAGFAVAFSRHAVAGN